MMWALDFTLNSVTMLALVLMVGIVIDDAIVVLENIFRFVEEKGMTPFEAARDGDARDRPGGARDDALAGRDLRAGLVHVVRSRAASSTSSASRRRSAMMVSLLVSFTLTPMMSARLLQRDERTASTGDEARSRGGLLRAASTAPTRALLAFAMRHRAGGRARWRWS